MKNVKLLLFVLTSFALGFSLGIFIKITYEASTLKPFSWGEPPKVINCYGKDFSKLQITRGISYWAIRGYPLGKYVHKPDPEICEQDWVEGMIILKKSNDLPLHTLASTKRYTNLITVKGAVIHYKPGAFNLDLINEHELGHALGFTHLEVENHIMHPLYHKMGRDFWIPVE